MSILTFKDDIMPDDDYLPKQNPSESPPYHHIIENPVFPSQKLVVLRGELTCARYIITRQINRDLLHEIETKTDSKYRALILTHLIARGLQWYMTHPLKLGWAIEYNHGLCGLQPQPEVPAGVFPDSAIEAFSRGVPIMRIVGYEPRSSSVGATLTMPVSLFNLVDRYVQTSQSWTSQSKNSTTWICHLAARGLWYYEQVARKSRKQKPVEILFNDGYFGVPFEDFPAWVELPELGENEVVKNPKTAKDSD
jgi:hypothetical protein